MSVHVCVCVCTRAAMLTYTHLKQIEGERLDKNRKETRFEFFYMFRE